MMKVPHLQMKESILSCAYLSLPCPSPTPTKLRHVVPLKVYGKMSKTTRGEDDRVNSKCKVKLETLSGCRLGIGRYPDFEYNAKGGIALARSCQCPSPSPMDNETQMDVNFDVESLHIPSLSYQTAKFMGIPLPPFLNIRILPLAFQGFLDMESGQVDLKLKAEFLFSMATIYKAAPLEVETMLTTEVAKGEKRSGIGRRMDSVGRCRLVGVAVVSRTTDTFINTFLSLPTECLADLSAKITLL